MRVEATSASATEPTWFLIGGGAAADVIERLDERTSPLGPPAAWPAALQHLVAAILPSDNAAVVFWGDEFVALYNDAYAATIGTKHPGAMGRPARENWSELWDDLGPLLAQVIGTGRTVSAKDRPFAIERGRGHETVFFDISYSPVREPGGRVGGVMCLVTETTERILAEARQRASESEFRLITDALPVLISFVDRDLVYRYLNRAYESWFGRSLSEIQGRTIEQLFGPELYEVRRPQLARVLAGETVLFDATMPSADGTLIDSEIRYLPRRDAAGAVDGFYILVIDIVDRKRAEVALRELNETLEQRVGLALAERRLWAQVFETTDALVAIVGLDFRFLAMNSAYAAAFERAYGVRPAVGDDILDLLAKRGAEGDLVRGLWSRAFAGEDFMLVQDFGSKEDDRPYYELRFSALRDAAGTIAGAFLYALDVTDRLRDLARLAEAEEQLRQSQKMEAIGQLTGGIAHDFNNLLTGIVGSIDLMQTRLSQGRTDGLGRYLDAALVSANRAAALTHRLLAFSRRQPLDPRPIMANALVASIEDLARRTLGESIEFDTRLAPGLWPTLCDANQLENALLNLVINARDAMPDGGRLTIATANSTLDAAYTATRPEVTPGDYVCVSVTDTGVGMPDDVIERAFEPFFTTKPMGQGTGLGLSMIYGFAQQSEGHARIASELGVGTTVRIYLPRHVAMSEIETAVTDEPATVAARGERILVVEDEAIVRGLVVELLAEFGYRTMEAEDGVDGLKLLQSKAEIDLLVTDIGLPGLNGRQLADAARMTRPDLKVLFITGYAENAALASGFLEPGMEMVTKPFTGDALLQKIQTMLADEKLAADALA